MSDNLFLFLNTVFEQSGFMGLFLVTGWFGLLALGFGIGAFFIWKVKGLQSEIVESQKSWQELITQRDEMLIDIINKVTTTNSQLVEKINMMQMLLLQLVGPNNGKTNVQ